LIAIVHLVSEAATSAGKPNENGLRGTDVKMLAVSLLPRYWHEKPSIGPMLDAFTEIITACLEAKKVVHLKRATQPSECWNDFWLDMVSQRLFAHQGLYG
jgi:hypothetical protein